MTKIFTSLPSFSILLLTLFFSFSSFASLSVLTEGNPRLYSYVNGDNTYKDKGGHKKLKVKTFDLLFEGADLKKGRIVFNNHPSIKSVEILKAKIKSEDGTFTCSGLVKFKEKKSPSEESFSLNLEPIKDGFNVEAEFKGIALKAELKKK